VAPTFTKNTQKSEESIISGGYMVKRFMRATYSLVDEWYELGEGLGVAKDVMDAIKVRYPDDHYSAKLKMFKSYIEMGNASYAHLAQVAASMMRRDIAMDLGKEMDRGRQTLLQNRPA